MKHHKVTVFQGADGQWYWRLRAPNGRTIAPSEGYKTRFGAVRAGTMVRDLLRQPMPCELEVRP